MHPLDQLLEWLSNVDFAVMGHGFAPHGRDYMLIVEDCLGSNPGQHEITFTHCVHFDYETRVRDDVWPQSWGNEYINYQDWQQAGMPDGYVWGTNWSNAYPGITKVEGSLLANEWSKRLSNLMYEVTLETDRFFIRIIFHSILFRKLSDETSTISQVIIPLK